MNHGLSDRQLAVLRQILSAYAEEIASVELFGSRATGDFRPNSDVDLVVRGTLKEKQIDRLWTMFHESNLPISVDVKSYELTTYPPLKAHMDKVCKPLFTQQDLQSVARRPEVSGV